MSKAIDVAQYLLDKAKNHGEVFTPMQILKMVYICYGYFTVKNNGKLFDDTIEAWRYGPVIPNLYHKIKRFKNNAIDGGIDGDSSNLSDEKKQLIDEVYDAYKQFSGLTLSSITHLKDSPWDKVYVEGFNLEITDDIIKPYYKKLYEEPESFDK